VLAADFERVWRAKERAEVDKKAAQLEDVISSREAIT
jgi:hypothetical protein